MCHATACLETLRTGVLAVSSAVVAHERVSETYSLAILAVLNVHVKCGRTSTVRKMPARRMANGVHGANGATAPVYVTVASASATASVTIQNQPTMD